MLIKSPFSEWQLINVGKMTKVKNDSLEAINEAWDADIIWEYFPKKNLIKFKKKTGEITGQRPARLIDKSSNYQ